MNSLTSAGCLWSVSTSGVQSLQTTWQKTCKTWISVVGGWLAAFLGQIADSGKDISLARLSGQRWCSTAKLSLTVLDKP